MLTLFKFIFIMTFSSFVETKQMQAEIMELEEMQLELEQLEIEVPPELE